jgi:hypothetical protein
VLPTRNGKRTTGVKPKDIGGRTVHDVANQIQQLAKDNIK